VPRQLYSYPLKVGECVRHSIGDYLARRYVMSLAHQYAAKRQWVYRCRSDQADVLIRRVA
jgi:hypothetical protein